MTEVLANYRPISNLKVISKIIEKIVAVRLQKYLEANQLNDSLQSAYKPFHSCEAALVLVHNDILVSIDKRHCHASTVRPVSCLRHCGSRYPPYTIAL